MPLDGPPAGIAFGGVPLGDRTAVPQLLSPSGGKEGGASGRGGRGWGRGQGVRGVQGGGRGGRRRELGGGLYVFPCGHKFHEFCLTVSSEGGRRGGQGVADVGGRGSAPPAVCSLCARSKVSRR